MKVKKRLILALFENPYPYKIKEMSGHSVAQFTTDSDNTYTLIAGTMQVPEGMIDWEPIGSSELPEYLTVMEIAFGLGKEINPLLLKTDDTGTGDSLRIFSTIGNIVYEIVNKKKPEYLFIPAKNNRKRLYQKMMKRLKSYELVAIADVSVYHNDSVVLLYRKD